MVTEMDAPCANALTADSFLSFNHSFLLPFIVEYPWAFEQNPSYAYSLDPIQLMDF